jgi:hypothetical protein
MMGIIKIFEQEQREETETEKLWQECAASRYGTATRIAGALRAAIRFRSNSGSRVPQFL